MKKPLIIFIVLINLIITPISIHASDLKSSDIERIILGFEENIDLNLSLLEGIPYELHHVLETIGAVSISIPSIYIDELRNKEDVAWIEPDYIVKTNGQVVDWGHGKTVDDHTKELGITGDGIKIGIIDTGISSIHPDLHVTNGKSFVENSATYEDNNGHGTHVAGIIAALDNDVGVIGVAPEADIYAIKSLDKSGTGRQTDIIAGIEWAIEQELDIVNLSITSNYKTIALEKVVEKAHQSGIILIAASGNDETGNGQILNDVMYPARYSSVIGVGAVDNSLVNSQFSYIGPSLDYTAPGENIFSTHIVNNGTGYAAMSGTSMAAPFATGVIALYLEVYPFIDKKSLEKIISTNALDLGESGKDYNYGHGFVQSPEKLFWDMQINEWFSDSVNFLRLEDYLYGFTDGSFRPTSPISRGEVVTLIGRAFQLDGTKRETNYEDVPADYYASGYIDSATEEGIITGLPNNRFEAASPITRGDAALMIARTFELLGSESYVQAFKDVNQEKYYAASINSLYEADIITGYPDGTYSPEKKISRAELSNIFAKALNEKTDK
ncbi:S8 family peptidase [Oceanobacillus sp. CF4.6]|uniref:S8 family peptidase n=1 Tax=Oceanobacillus sp. CF4.6 TaxID=3373080 RepID=UPI003EE552C1